MNNLTQKVKNYAYSLGADLVGIAPTSRWEKAPIQHSPEGIFPKAKSVIVCALHLPDACVELGAEKDVREPGTGLVLVNVSSSLSVIGYWMAKFLEELGWNALTIPVTGYWTYRKRPGAERGWIADMSHYYAAAAGLGEIGWNGVVLTPQFGGRQCFGVILTDAVLTEDELYKGKTLCKRCYKCVESCPAGAISKDESISISIEGKTFTWGKINQLRCDWVCKYGLLGEGGPKYFYSKNNFPIPEDITPEILYETIKKADRLQRPGYTGIVEKCFVECPVRNTKGEKNG